MNDDELALSWLVDDNVGSGHSGHHRGSALNDDGESPFVDSPSLANDPSPLLFPPDALDEPFSPSSSSDDPPFSPFSPSLSYRPSSIPTSSHLQQPNVVSQSFTSGSADALQFQQSSSEAVDAIALRVKLHDEQLAAVRTRQHALLLQSSGSFDELKGMHAALHRQLQHDLQALEQLMAGALLLPSLLHRCDRMLVYIRLQLSQIEIFNQELRAHYQRLSSSNSSALNTAGSMDLGFYQNNNNHSFSSSSSSSSSLSSISSSSLSSSSSSSLSSTPNAPPIFARLCIASQPISGVITKGKQVEEANIIVKLLFGVTMRFSSVSHMRVQAQWEDQQARIASSAEKPLLESEVQPLDVYRFQTHWKHKFATGTRKTLVFLRYSLSLRVSDGLPPLELRSEWSRPFIVITNDCQWHEAEGKLIQHALFKKGPAPWPLVANTLQRHFLECTRQSPAQAPRLLFASELHYFHQGLLLSKALVPAALFDQFWEWFGRSLQKLRYQRHVAALFLQGFLQGFLTKHACAAILAHQPTGTFLIRFSERYAGSFAITYRAVDQAGPDSIRHYLVKPEDISGPKQTIADFLGQQISLTHLLKVAPRPDGRPHIAGRVPKDEILAPLYAKRAQISSADGYDTRIQTVKSFIE